MHDAPVPVHPLLQASFEGRPLNVLSVHGRPAWIARELGAAIGYARGGKRLVNRIREEWASEFLPNHDYAFVSGEDLALLKGLAEPDVIDRRTPSLLVLFESGVHLVLTRTSKPIGRRLRRFLVDEVLPQIARVGRFAPVEDPQPMPEHVASVLLMFPEFKPRRPALHVLREERMSLQARTRAQWVDVCERRLKVLALHRLVDTVGDELPVGARAAVEILAAEIATGLPVRDLLDPDPDPDPDPEPGVAIDLVRLQGGAAEAA